jgi:hypothetical protein
MKWRLVACVLAGAAVSGLGTAGEIYRWVDEQGRVQMSDRPPPKAPGQVTKQDAPRNEVTPEQRKAAEDQAARDKARLKGAETERDNAVVPASKPRAAASSGYADESDPTLPPRASAEDCRMWRQEYYRSLACFAPFRTVYGGIKAEAFAVCGTEIMHPEFECRWRK